MRSLLLRATNHQRQRLQDFDFKTARKMRSDVDFSLICDEGRRWVPRAAFFTLKIESACVSDDLKEIAMTLVTIVVDTKDAGGDARWYQSHRVSAR